MNSVQTLLIGLLGLLLTGCLSPSRAAEGLPVRSLARAAFSGIQDPKQEVIKDKAVWEETWARHVSKAKGAPPRPDVDFTKEMVIMAAMGRKNSGGYSIQVTSVKPVGDKLQVNITQIAPPPGAMTIQALTSPIQFVAVPRSDLEPEFKETTATAEKRPQKQL